MSVHVSVLLSVTLAIFLSAHPSVTTLAPKPSVGLAVQPAEHKETERQTN